MTATQFQAMLYAGKVSGTGERELKKHLSQHLGKDIKKVMNNASHVFDCISVVFKEGKRDDCLLPDAEIESLCLHFVRCLFCGTEHFR